jgi:hypothetical protein
MKNLIKPLVFLALFTVAGVITYLVMQHRGEYLRGLEVSTAEQRAKAAGNIKTLETQVEAKTNETNLMRQECVKGATAYAKLPINTKRVTPEPNCGG